MNARARRSITETIVIAAVIVVGFCRIVAHDWPNFDDPIHVTENTAFFPVSWPCLLQCAIRVHRRFGRAGGSVTGFARTSRATAEISVP
jgi:hypothetical protein